MDDGLDRRELLARGARLALGAAVTPLGLSLVGCSDDPSPVPATTTPPVRTGGPDWGRLADAMDGTLVLPGASSYDADRVLFNPRFDDLRPAAVARVATVDDVTTAVSFADANEVALAIRSGGHTYAGYSSGDGVLQLDLRGLDDISVGDGTATLGPGTLLVDAYSTLFDAGRCIPGGSCPTVGVAGLALGGGIGFLGRRFGLLADNLEALEMVTVDGRTVSTADEPDLLWASRGGGGGNFGIVTSLTFRTHPVGDWSTFQLGWGWDRTPDVAAAWLAWLDDLPDEVWSMLSFTTQDTAQGSTPICQVKGQVTAPSARARELLGPLVAAVGAPPTSEDVTDRTWMGSVELWGGCTDLGVSQCRTAADGPSGQLPRQAYKAKSDYFATAPPAEAVAVVVEALEERQADPALTGAGADFLPGGIELDSYGGALNAPAPTDTAFVHRDQLTHGQYLAFWSPDAPSEVVEANEAWIERFATRLGRFASGQAYQNYIDPDRRDWLTAYYGENLDRLIEVKRAWDPDGRLAFPQGIPTTR